MKLNKIIIYTLMLIGMISLSYGALTDNIEAYWTFNNTLTDSTGNGNTLTNNGATYTPSGKIAGAYSYDGVNDYMNRNSYAHSNTTGLTINFWVYFDVLSTNRPLINLDNGAFTGRTYRLFYQSSNFQFAIGNGATTYPCQINDGGTTTTGTYHMITATYDGNNIKLFIDNSQVGSTVACSQAISTIAETLYIGGGDGSALWLDGRLDELGIWNRALSNTEVTDLYNSGDGLQYPFSTPSEPEITIDDISLINNSYFNSNFDISLNLTNTSTNSNINTSYSIDGDTLVQFGTNTLKPNVTINISTLTESSHTIYFYAYNNETNVTSTNYTFTIDTTAPFIDNENLYFSTIGLGSIPIEINSYNLDIPNAISCTDDNLLYCNITIEGTNYGDFYTLAGKDYLNVTHNYTNNAYINFSVYAEDLAGNFVTTTRTATDVKSVFVNPLQYFRFNNTATGQYLEDYSFGDFSTNSTYLSMPIYNFTQASDYYEFPQIAKLGLGNHSLEFVKDGYVSEFFDFTFTNTSALNVTYNVTPVTLNIKAYNVDTDNQIFFNLTILNATDSKVYYNQFNFSELYNETITGDIELIISSDGYNDVTYFNTLNPDTSITLKAYLFNNTATDVIQFTVQSQDQGIALENVLVELQRLVNGSYVTLAQGETEASGKTFFYVDNSVSYKVIFSKDGYVSATATTIPGVTEYTVKLAEIGTSYDYVKDISYSFTPTNTLLSTNETIKFTGFISGNSFTLIEYRLYYDNGTTIYSNSSTNPTGTTFSTIQTLPYNLNVTYIYSQITYYQDSQVNTISKQYQVITFNNESIMQTLKNYGNQTDEETLIVKWFIILIVSLIIIVSGAIAGVQTLNLLIIPAMAFFTVIGWLDWTRAAVVIFVAVILFMGGRK